MPLGLQAIRPKRLAPVNTARVLADAQRANKQYGLKVAAKMQKYPSQEPTDYVRTGDYGRGWTAPGAVKATPHEVTVVNRVKYSVYVGGPKGGGRKKGERQAAVMRKKGWPSITDVARETKKDYSDLVNRAIRGRPG